MPEEEVRVAQLKAFKTKSGNTRYVLVDDQGREFSTFKEQIAAKLPGLEGKRARVKYRQQQREGFTNVYLDHVEPLEAPESGEHETDEVAWKTAMDAAPISSARRPSSPRVTSSRSCSRSRSWSPRTSRRTATASRARRCAARAA